MVFSYKACKNHIVLQLQNLVSKPQRTKWSFVTLTKMYLM